MAKRTETIRVILFFLLVAGEALCQIERPSADSLQRLRLEGANSPDVQRQETLTWRSLPDAPSTVQPPEQAEKFQTFVDAVRSPSAIGEFGINTRITHKPELGYLTPRLPLSFTSSHEAVFTQKESYTFLDKYLYPSSIKQNVRYHPSAESSFMGRATYAASRILITRDESGKERLNTRYFLGVLTSVVTASAYRPYWTRSTSATFNNFGSTIGNDAGMNLFHEFGPGIRQTVKSHAPKFVSTIGDRALPTTRSRGRSSPHREDSPVVSPLHY